MKIEAEQVLARFHLTSTDRHHDEPVYEWLVHSAHRDGLQGATVLRGFLGLAVDGRLIREESWSIAHRVPVIVEIVDTAQRISRLLADVEQHLPPGLVTLERARVVLYRHAHDPDPADPQPSAPFAEGSHTVHEVVAMTEREPGTLLRVFIGESDVAPESGQPLYEALVERARDAGLAGATVLRGPLGFGKHSRVHAARLLDVSTDLPVVIEIVDRGDRIQAFLPTVDQLVDEGLVTLEKVEVLRYGPQRVASAPDTTSHPGGTKG